MLRPYWPRMLSMKIRDLLHVLRKERTAMLEDVTNSSITLANCSADGVGTNVSGFPSAVHPGTSQTCNVTCEAGNCRK